MFDSLPATSNASVASARTGAAASARGSIEDVLGDRRALQARVRELEAANDALRQTALIDASRLRSILRELALAADRAGDRPLARVIRGYLGLPAERLCDGACAERGNDGASCPGVGAGPRLSARERQVLGLLSEGTRSSAIASQLGISAGTVEVHRRNIMRKLGLHTAVALTKYALREGLTSL